ncbi:type II secretion system protein [Candidatus Fermentibacteria bacterium]|nr:type II secretion system protein [Candidatus Fermentibacteria bacterium]
MKKGMTLVETMVAMVILGIVGGALVVVFTGHINMSRPLQTQQIMVHDARAAYDVLARELRHTNAIEHGVADSVQFRAMVGGVSQRYKYAIREGSLRREAGGGGMQEIVPNATLLRFRYLMVDGTEVPLPITNANDEQVKRIHIRLIVTQPDRRDSLQLSGFIAPRNLR